MIIKKALQTFLTGLNTILLFSINTLLKLCITIGLNGYLEMVIQNGNKHIFFFLSTFECQISK